MIIKRIVIAPYERGLKYEAGALTKIWQPGVYWTMPFSVSDRVEVRNITDPTFACSYVDELLSYAKNLCDEHFLLADIGEDEIGLVYVANRLVQILKPGARQLYWRNAANVQVKTVVLGSDIRIDTTLTKQLLASDALNASKFVKDCVQTVKVETGQMAMVYADGVLVDILEPGLAMYWRVQSNISVKYFSTRITVVEVCGQEILTKDRVSLRVNLSAAYQVIDAVEATSLLENVNDFAYRELQLALRRAVGTRTIDELLADKTALDNMITKEVTVPLAKMGIRVTSAGVKDVILPGEMKDILNQVVSAEKAAQANNIRRREETASTRSLMNTAKLMEQNPVLVRLKELETLEKVTDRIDRLTVFGGLDGVLKDMVKINT